MTPEDNDRRAELHRQRARDMLEIIDRPGPAGSTPELRPCSARELEWLQPENDLVDMGVTRTGTATIPRRGVVTPYAPSMLVVLYSARYVVSTAAAAKAFAGTRGVFTVYGVLQAAYLPSTRNIEL